MIRIGSICCAADHRSAARQIAGLLLWTRLCLMKLTSALMDYLLASVLLTMPVS